METIQNAASSASKMLFGESKTESGQEPVSGSQGQGTTTEPFDQGNKDAGADGPTTSSSTAPENPSGTNVGGSQPTSTATGDHSATGNQPATSSSAGGDIGSAGGNTGSVGGNTGSAGGDTGSAGGNTGSAVGDTSSAGGDAGSSDPSTGSGVNERQKPIQKQQGADKPMDEPTGEQKDAVKESKDKGEELLAKRDPNDHSGEPLKVHDGSEKKEEEGKSGEGDAQENQSEEQGSGEQYVKSTGLAADGGDFDATKPGAGAEANRLLEQKGVHKDDQGKQQVDESASGAATHEDKSKPKTMDKIKEKLHIGKH